MTDLALRPCGGKWLLVDEDDAEIGVFASREDAFQVIEHHARVEDEPRWVMVCSEEGEWEEAVVDGRLH